MESNYTLNYLALLSCLISSKPLNVERTIKIITGQNIFEIEINESISSKVLVIDTDENKTFEFLSQGKAAKFLGVNRNTVGIYVKSKKMYKNRYYFERIDKL